MIKVKNHLLQQTAVINRIENFLSTGTPNTEENSIATEILGMMPAKNCEELIQINEKLEDQNARAVLVRN